MDGKLSDKDKRIITFRANCYIVRTILLRIKRDKGIDFFKPTKNYDSDEYNRFYNKLSQDIIRKDLPKAASKNNYKETLFFKEEETSGKSLFCLYYKNVDTNSYEQITVNGWRQYFDNIDNSKEKTNGNKNKMKETAEFKKAKTFEKIVKSAIDLLFDTNILYEDLLINSSTKIIIEDLLARNLHSRVERGLARVIDELKAVGFESIKICERHTVEEFVSLLKEKLRISEALLIIDEESKKNRIR